MGLPRKNSLVPLARKLRHNATNEERKLWYEFLYSYTVPFTQQKIIGNFIVDFFCNKARLSIELDGSQHYEEEAKIKDEYRTRYLELLEIKELRFSNHDVRYHFDDVCEAIHTEVTKRRNDIIELPLSLVSRKK